MSAKVLNNDAQVSGFRNWVDSGFHRHESQREDG